MMGGRERSWRGVVPWLLAASSGVGVGAYAFVSASAWSEVPGDAPVVFLIEDCGFTRDALDRVNADPRALAVALDGTDAFRREVCALTLSRLARWSLIPEGLACARLTQDAAVWYGENGDGAFPFVAVGPRPVGSGVDALEQVLPRAPADGS